MGARIQPLRADISSLDEEYVLVQAFKKTVNYIRHHNWFADVMELDLATVNYPAFIANLRKELSRPTKWKSSRVRLVPAPKSAEWWINSNNEWEPRPSNGDPQSAKLRPLGHVPLRDQVAATAIMLCLADAVETIQGDPTLEITLAENRRRVISYGNRLFCDSHSKRGEHSLQHRWGASKLYRAYFADYQTFVSRPEYVASSMGERSTKKTVIVHSDLSKFYDRVRPALLHSKIQSRLGIEDTKFLRFLKKVLDWEWDERDVVTATMLSGIDDFTSLALPQGLVVAGFFSNIVLLDFDDALREAFDTKIANRVYLRDACRYVDDLRLVVEVPRNYELSDIEQLCHKWIEDTLKQTAPGLAANGDKTRAVAFHDTHRVIIRQSRRMQRIQETVSGGIDVNGGTQLLAALEGLFNTIGQFAETDGNGSRWPLKTMPDVRDETVARFVAGRYRTTYRSLRPLLEDEVIRSANDQSFEENEPDERGTAMLSREELDRQSQAFSLRLIEEWIRNPGNVRLLRVGLDLYPEATVLESVLGLLKPLVIEEQDDNGGTRHVAIYCLAEIFRAAATETGLVPDQELLPSGVDVEQYQDTLRDFASELLAEHWDSLPWFCRQQVLLFLAVVSPTGVDTKNAIDDHETADYALMLAFLQGQPVEDAQRWTTNAVLARQSYLDLESTNRLLVPQMTTDRLTDLADLAPSVAEELIVANRRLRRLAPKALLDLLSLPSHQPISRSSSRAMPLVEEARRWDCRIRDELNLVRFASDWLAQRANVRPSLPPSVVTIQFLDGQLPLTTFGQPSKNPFFKAPAWCSARERWRIELGLVLRFAITGQSDPTCTFRHSSWRESENCYRAPAWHWEVRRPFPL